jgi:putative FmdB family regulatory protein
MPLYEFACDTCNTKSTELLSVEDRDQVVKCVKCDEPMERQIGTFRTVAVHNTDNDKKILFSTGKSREH